MHHSLGGCLTMSRRSKNAQPLVVHLMWPFLACSPYKFFAPHMGALYGKREHRLSRRHLAVRRQLQRVTAGDLDDLTRQPTGSLRREKNDHIGNVVRLTNPL